MTHPSIAAIQPELEKELEQLNSNGVAPIVSTGEVSSWSEIDLQPLVQGGDLEDPPKMLARTDGVCLLYKGKNHAILSEPEHFKTWLAGKVAAERLTVGEHVVFIDFEDGPRTHVERLRALGVPDEAVARFHYARPDEPLGDEGRRALEAILVHGPTVALIDGVTEALTLHGLDLGSNADVAKWLGLLPRWFTARGVSVLQLDHVAKAKDGRGRWAIGAQHKLAGVDVAYTIEMVEPFGRGLTGRAKLGVSKDRPGHVRQHALGERIADVVLVSNDDGSVEIRLDPPEKREGPFRPSGQMERVSKLLEAQPGLSKTAIRSAISGKNEVIDLALELLIAEVHVEIRKQGQAHRHYVVRTYREAEDQLA